MRVLLRKYHGRLEAFLGSNRLTAGSASTRGYFALPSMVAIALIVLMFVVAFALTHLAPVQFATAGHLHQPIGLAAIGSVTKIREMREKRAATITAARGILDKAESEKRELNAEEKASYDKHLTDEARQAEEIKREERQLELERSLAGESIPADTRATPAAGADGPRVDASSVA